MRGVFDEPELEVAAPRPDTELTLNSLSLTLLFLGLVLLCALCFALGYSMGHHALIDPRNPQASTPAAGGLSDAPTDAHADKARSKPSANAPPVSGSQATTASLSVQASHVPDTPLSKQWVAVKPALDAGAPVEAARQSTALVTPAMPAAGSYMVQVASVSNAEDADVLTSALKRHGYAVTVRREPLDGLIHVRIGAFKTDEEAQKWRQKLLNDGYNAIVQP